MKKMLGLALVAASFVPCFAMAEEAAAPNTGALSLSGGVDMPSEYIFRGGVIQNEGVIAQPYATLTVKAYDSEDFAISPYAGIWSDLQSSKGASTSTLFETDYFGGVDFRIHDFTLGAVYTFYTYPGNGLSEVQELGLKASYSDAKIMKEHNIPFTINPYVAWYFETEDASNTGKQQYAELGVNPSYALGNTGVTLGLPIAFGLTPDGYFTKDDGSSEYFGFASIGATASYALPVPARFGAWSLNGGLYYYYLNADSLQAANDNDPSNVLAKIGLSFVY